MSFLKGTIYITEDMNIINSIPYNGNARIVSLDEDNILPENNITLVGTCLLPPMEAKIAEVDGNQELYDTIYSNHLLMPYQQQFASALISYLYKGGNLILFLPELGYNNTKEMVIYQFYKLYGIHIGLIGAQDPQVANCYYDETCIPMWLNSIYSVSAITPYEFLYMYPLDAVLSNNVIIKKLVEELNPYGENYNDQVGYIHRLHKQLHINPNIRPAICNKWDYILEETEYAYVW